MPSSLRTIVRVFLADVLFRWAVRLAGTAPVAHLEGVERVVVTNLTGPGEARVELRVRVAWTWLGHRQVFQHRAHARLGGTPSLDRSDGPVLVEEARGEQ